jgi:hypothetical protein
MGVMHFAGLGKSAGAVTAGLGCAIARHGRSHPQHGTIVENLVIFTSPEIAEGDERAFDALHNEYMSRTVRKDWADGMHNTVEIVTGFVDREFLEAGVYLVCVDVNDFSDCFDAVARAVLKFHEPGKVGKHIWANVTGGSNILNAALIQCAHLSGCIARLYYTFVADLRQHGKYLQAFSRDERAFRYREIYALKTHFDERHRLILETLERIEELDPGSTVTSKELLSRLKGIAPLRFQSVDLSAFRCDFLNVMQGIERLGDRITGQKDAVRLGDDGREILALVRRPLFQALVNRRQLDRMTVEDEIGRLNIRRLDNV